MLRLVNWRKRLAKFDDNRLRPGENVRATMVLQIKGAVARGALIGGMSGAARGVAGSTSAYVPSSAIARTGHPEGARYPVDGLAGELPIAPLLLVLTDHDRVLVFSFVLGSLKLTYETEFLASRLREIEVSSGFFARKATLRFADGSHVTFDLPRVHEHRAFCRRFRHDGRAG
jgi:hypothetical protein